MNHDLTRHAVHQIAVLGFSEDEIRFALHYGKKIHRTGVTFFFVGKKQIPKKLSRTHHNIEGLTVIVDGRTMITAYKNRSAISNIKKKNKRMSTGMRDE